MDEVVCQDLVGVDGVLCVLADLVREGFGVGRDDQNGFIVFQERLPPAHVLLNFHQACTLGEAVSERGMSDTELEDGVKSRAELYRVEVAWKSREKFLVQHFTNNGAPTIGM